MSDELKAGLRIELPMKELRKRSIFLASPMYGGMCAGPFARSLSELSAVCKEMKIPLVQYFLFNESLITRARNYCADAFMRSGCTHLMFIDSDIQFNPYDVLAMLALAGPSSPYDLIAGPYPKKCIAWEKIKAAVDKGFADENPENLSKYVGDYVLNPKFQLKKDGSGMEALAMHINQPVEVMEAGTGFMMIRRQTLEKFAAAYPEMSYRPDNVRDKNFDGSRSITAFFDCIIDRGYTIDDTQKLINELAEGKRPLEELKAEAANMLKLSKTSSRRYLSEDYLHCQYIQRIGMKVWMCPWIKLAHFGSYMFGGSLLDLAQLGEVATADMTKIDKMKKARK